jgi:histidyl-tRNA synthetase
MSEGKKSVYKPKPVSGFPEWLPEVRIVEQQWLDHIRRVFESYGFCSIETPSVEELEVLHAKGEVDKEIYVLERLHREEGDKEARLALHFDQTVPLARYVAQNFNDLVFPFKRYQMQRVWRGERPQKGRFREFTQCDIDVINIDALPLHFDAEMPAIIWETLMALPGMKEGKIQIRINNRKIQFGHFETCKVADPAEVLRILDKKDKIGAAAVQAQLTALGPTPEYVSEWLALMDIKAKTSEELRSKIAPLKITNETFLAGVNELCFVLDNLKHLPKEAVVADLSIVRGLDYYTGTVYETVFVDDPTYGSICSGGRYEDLASQYINKKLPGVGISIGFSRLFAYLLEKGALPVGQKSPAHVLMVLPSEERRADAAAAAQKLRARGYNVELYHAAKKIPDQLKYASRKGIPFVWFPPFEEGRPHEVKNMTTGEQKAADPQTWEKNNGD